MFDSIGLLISFCCFPSAPGPQVDRWQNNAPVTKVTKVPTTPVAPAPHTPSATAAPAPHTPRAPAPAHLFTGMCASFHSLMPIPTSESDGTQEWHYSVQPAHKRPKLEAATEGLVRQPPIFVSNKSNLALSEDVVV